MIFRPLSKLTKKAQNEKFVDLFERVGASISIMACDVTYYRVAFLIVISDAEWALSHTEVRGEQ